MPHDGHLLLTCEHGGCSVPPRYRHLFRGQRRVLRSHRGYDPGSLDLSQRLAARLKAPLLAATVTRLLVELNRSLGHPKLFSEFTEPLRQADKQMLLQDHYLPHREAVDRRLAEIISKHARAWHVCVHTFTPVLRGEVRTADVGLLYDPRRPLEWRWVEAWRKELGSCRPELAIRRNYPYLGRADGLTTFLRRRFGPRRYAGIELEVNQRWVRGGTRWRCLQRDLAESLAAALGSL